MRRLAMAAVILLAALVSGTDPASARALRPFFYMDARVEDLRGNLASGALGEVLEALLPADWDEDLRDDLDLSEDTPWSEFLPARARIVGFFLLPEGDDPGFVFEVFLSDEDRALREKIEEALAGEDVVRDGDRYEIERKKTVIIYDGSYLIGAVSTIEEVRADLLLNQVDAAGGLDAFFPPSAPNLPMDLLVSGDVGNLLDRLDLGEIAESVRLGGIGGVILGANLRPDGVRTMGHIETDGTTILDEFRTDPVGIEAFGPTPRDAQFAMAVSVSDLGSVWARLEEISGENETARRVMIRIEGAFAASTGYTMDEILPLIYGPILVFSNFDLADGEGGISIEPSGSGIILRLSDRGRFEGFLDAAAMRTGPSSWEKTEEGRTVFLGLGGFDETLLLITSEEAVRSEVLSNIESGETPFMERPDLTDEFSHLSRGGAVLGVSSRSGARGAGAASWTADGLFIGSSFTIDDAGRYILEARIMEAVASMTAILEHMEAIESRSASGELPIEIEIPSEIGTSPWNTPFLFTSAPGSLSAVSEEGETMIRVDIDNNLWEVLALPAVRRSGGEGVTDLFMSRFSESALRSEKAGERMLFSLIAENILDEALDAPTSAWTPASELDPALPSENTWGEPYLYRSDGVSYEVVTSRWGIPIFHYSSVTGEVTDLSSVPPPEPISE